MAEIEFTHACADVETTGLNSATDEVIEVTVTQFNRSKMIGESKSFLCRPKSGFIPKAASDVNGITYDMVKEARNYLEDGVREEIAEVIGDRILVGHNIEKFDLGFLKIKPKMVEDTLVMARRRFPGRSNKLKTLCQRLNIPWNDREAHRSGYDVEKTIDAYLKLKDFEESQAQKKAEAPIFAAAIERSAKSINEDHSSVGVLPSEKEKKLVATQAYSYSRINLFKRCPFKWFMQYVKRVKQPEETYLVTGSVVHKIAERSGEWCFRELFANKFVIFARKRGLTIEDDEIRKVSSFYQIDNVTVHDYGKYIFENPKEAKSKFGVKGLYALIVSMDKDVSGESYEIPTMPPLSEYEQIIQGCINQFKVTDIAVKKDVRILAERFYRNANFSLLPGHMVLTEKRMAYDKNWNILNDFYAKNVFFRAVIDVIYYYGRTILIKDYKTSRKMLKEADMYEDMQLLIYVLMVYKFIPRNSYNQIIIQVDYIRFGKTIELVIDDVEHYINKALKWINESIQDIEKEMLKTDGSAFAPVRNEYCHTCHIGGDGLCPLFNKNMINKIDDPFSFVIESMSECVDAWKRVEANKSESSRLTKMCKSFVEQCDQSVIIDKHAILDFYTFKKKDYDPVKTVQLFLKKGIPIEQILSFMSFPPSQVEKFIEYREVNLTEEEIESVSSESTKTEFSAMTLEQAKSKGAINS